MQCPVNVYYNKELKVTIPITISSMDSLKDGIRDTIVYSMTQSVPPVPQNAKYEKATVTKELTARAYHLLPYYLSKIIAEVPFNLINPVIFVLICYFIIGL